jgi:glycerophosphoryl diester phosphodiesterase
MKAFLVLSILLLSISCGREKDSGSSSDNLSTWPYGSGYSYYTYPYNPAYPYNPGIYPYPYPNPYLYPIPVPAVNPVLRFPPATTLRERLEGRQVGAHQGGAIDLAGNTIPRFEEAYQYGADIVEMDLQITKDGVVIVYHDYYLERFTNCTGLVADKTWAEIQKCDKLYFYKINSLEEVLKWSNGKIIINAEFKFVSSVVPAIKLVQKYNAYNWVYFQAKSDPVIYQTARDFDPEISLLFAPNNMEQLNWALDLGDENLVVIELNEGFRSTEIIDTIHDAGKLVSENAWHFSSIHEAFGAACEPLFEMNIDIAITDKTPSCIDQREDLEN